MIEITLNVDGMHCGMCECHVNDAVRGACAVKKVTSSHAKNRTVVLADDSVDPETVCDAIRKQGYTVGSVTVKPYQPRGFAKLFGGKK